MELHCLKTGKHNHHLNITIWDFVLTKLKKYLIKYLIDDFYLLKIKKKERGKIYLNDNKNLNSLSYHHWMIGVFIYLELLINLSDIMI